MSYQPGDTVRLPVTFTVAGVATDPTAVTLTLRVPSGVTTTYVYLTDVEVVRASQGNYRADFVVTTAGVYAWKWEGTGTAAGVDEGTFTVEGSLLGSNSLCSVDDVKTSLEITNDDYDDLIQGLIVTASAAIPQRYQREFIGPTGGTRTFSVGRTGSLVDLAPYDLRSGGIVTLHPEEGGVALALDSEYALAPEGGARLGGTYQQIRLSSRLVMNSTLNREFGRSRLRVAGNWGCFSDTSTLDETIKRAAVLTVSSWMDRAVADFAIPEAFEEGRTMRPDRFGTYAIPAAAHSLLMPWGRIGTY